MKRTKEWWNNLTKEERSRLVYLERAYSESISYLGCRCKSCDKLHVGAGLCKSCYKEMKNLINKANKAMKE